MLHRAALTLMTCSVLAHLEPHQASVASGFADVLNGSPATIHTWVTAARPGSPAVVYGNNGQPPPRASLTW